MSKKTKVELLIEEKEALKKRESMFEEWRWKASTTFYETGILTETQTTTRYKLGFRDKHRLGQSFDAIPYEVAKGLHSFLADERDKAHRRIYQIDEELERLSEIVEEN